MLKQASVGQVKKQQISREGTYLAITMRFYPRFLRKELRDEFLCHLAPVKDLLHEFNAAQRRLGDHNSSFAEVDYEQRFTISVNGMAQLKRLAELSRKKDVYLICVCDLGERCHREILMELANRMHGAEIDRVYHEYPVFMRRFELSPDSIVRNHPPRRMCENRTPRKSGHRNLVAH